MITGLRRFVSNASGDLVSSTKPSSYKRAPIGSASRSRQTLASIVGGPGSTGGFNASSTIVDKNVSLGFLDGFLPHNDMHTRNRIFRDIYEHDPVCGGAVDIQSVMPFSDFVLKGIKDREILDKYVDCCESLHLKSLLPAISRDYCVMGKFIGSLFFDSNEKIFTALMPQNAENCEITEVNIFGMAPLVDLKVPEGLKKLLSRNDPRVKRILDTMPDEAKQYLKEGTVPLQPENTLYIPRRGLSNDSIGTSLYERVLPWHLLEKTLTRGTIDIAQRRQHGVLHITVTGDEDFIPTPNDLENIKSLFVSADADPTGAVIVTRQGIMPSEITSAGQFWRIDESIQAINDQKYKALGISESLLSGDATYSSLDASMSVYVEQLKNYRGHLTREIFYDKIFPAIAVANDFTKEGFETRGSTSFEKNRAFQRFKRNMGLVSDTQHQFKIGADTYDTRKLIIPQITWLKSLAPVGDSQYLDMLNTLRQEGIPVSIAALCAAGGVSIDDVLSTMDENLSITKQIYNYNKKLAKYQPQQEDEGDNNFETQASALEYLAGRPSIKPIPLRARNWDERHDVHDVKKDGSFRPISKKGSNYLKEKQAKKLSKVLANIREREIAKAKNTSQKPKKYHHS